MIRIKPIFILGVLTIVICVAQPVENESRSIETWDAKSHNPIENRLLAEQVIAQNPYEMKGEANNEFGQGYLRSKINTFDVVNVVDSILVLVANCSHHRHTFGFNSAGKRISHTTETQYEGYPWLRDDRTLCTYDTNDDMTNYLWQSWDGSEWRDDRQYDFVYDQHGDLISRERSFWNEIEWVNDYRYSYSYSAQHEMLSWIIEDWVDQAWINQTKQAHEFDSNGNRICTTWLDWEGTVWVNRWKMITTYNPFGSIESRQWQDWMGAEWVNDRRYVDTFDVEGKRLTSTVQNWTSTEWANSIRKVYIYDVEGNQLSETHTSWDNSEWINGSRVEYSYNAIGGRTTMLFLDWGSNGWYNQYRDTNGYDTDGNLTSRVWESWDWTAWQGQSRYSWEYDSDANMISYLSEYWDGLSWVLNNSSFHITDSFGNHYTIGAGNANIYYGLVPLANEWGTDFPSNILQAQNFPNPFNPSTTIEYYLPEPTDVSLIIYDVTGREVNTLVSTSQSSGNYKVRWGGTNRDGLQVAAGMYFARLQAGEHQSVVKMVYLR